MHLAHPREVLVSTCSWHFEGVFVNEVEAWSESVGHGVAEDILSIEIILTKIRIPKAFNIIKAYQIDSLIRFIFIS